MSFGFLKREGIDYISNFYRYKLYDKESKTYLLTTDDGKFVFLSLNAFQQLKRGKILDDEIFNILLDKGIVVTSNNFDDIVQSVNKRYSFLENGTSLHLVIPTHRCNLGCVYCFASSCQMNAPQEHNDMDEKTAKQVVEFIMKSPSYAITIEFQGGEPLARFDIIQLMVTEAKRLNEVYQKDLRFALVSNFTLLTDEIANWLMDNGVSFCTSFDGPKVVHDANRFLIDKNGDHIGTYDKVVHWVKRVNELYKLKGMKEQVYALMTITKKSLNYHKEILDEYVALNMNIVNVRSLTQVGRANGENKDSIFYTKQEFTDFYKKSLEYIKELKTKGINVKERTEQLYQQKVVENIPTYHADYESPCGALTGNIIYHFDGNIYTCNEALGRDEFKVGNVFEDKWQDVFKRKETGKAILNSMLEQNVKCDRCVYKPYCGTCMVENFYRDSKFNFYPDKTQRHHETIFQCEKILDKLLDNELK